MSHYRLQNHLGWQYYSEMQYEYSSIRTKQSHFASSFRLNYVLQLHIDIIDAEIIVIIIISSIIFVSWLGFQHTLSILLGDRFTNVFAELAEYFQVSIHIIILLFVQVLPLSYWFPGSLCISKFEMHQTPQSFEHNIMTHIVSVCSQNNRTHEEEKQTKS